MSKNKKVIFEIKNLTVYVTDDHGKQSQKIVYGSFDICSGDFIIIQGRNGSGKSTLCHLLALTKTNYFSVNKEARLIYHAEGFPRESICDYDNEKASALCRDVVYIDQEDNFQGPDSGYDVLYEPAEVALDEKFSGRHLHEKREQLKECIENYYDNYIQAALKSKSLKEFKRKKATDYSGGQKKMLHILAGLIKAEVCESQMIIMDEPLNNLDGKNKCYLNNILSAFRNEKTAILMITHCQIFDGINRVLIVDKKSDALSIASIEDRTVEPHRECLEDYDDCNFHCQNA